MTKRRKPPQAGIKAARRKGADVMVPDVDPATVEITAEPVGELWVDTPAAKLQRAQDLVPLIAEVRATGVARPGEIAKVLNARGLRGPAGGRLSARSIRSALMLADPAAYPRAWGRPYR